MAGHPKGRETDRQTHPKGRETDRQTHPRGRERERARARERERERERERQTDKKKDKHEHAHVHIIGTGAVVEQVMALLAGDAARLLDPELGVRDRAPCITARHSCYDSPGYLLLPNYIYYLYHILIIYVLY